MEIAAAESSRKALTDALGKERRDRVLAALYIVRQDAVSVVRQSSIHIWKALVHNTPRTGNVTAILSLLSSLTNLFSTRASVGACHSAYRSARGWGQ